MFFTSFISLTLILQSTYAASLYQNESPEDTTYATEPKNYITDYEDHLRGKSWTQMSSALNYGWDSVLSFTKAVANQSVYAYNQLTGSCLTMCSLNVPHSL